jgi:hypothetical protein
MGGSPEGRIMPGLSNPRGSKLVLIRRNSSTISVPYSRSRNPRAQPAVSVLTGGAPPKEITASVISSSKPATWRSQLWAGQLRQQVDVNVAVAGVSEDHNRRSSPPPLSSDGPMYSPEASDRNAHRLR